MLPIIEMAGSRAKLVPESTYLYLDKYAQSDNILHGGSQGGVYRRVMQKEKYSVIDCLYHHEDGSCMEAHEYMMTKALPRKSN